MLAQFFNPGIPLGLAQAGATALLALGVMLLARQRQIHVERETIFSLLRGFLQIIAVGLVLVLLLRGSSWTSIFVLLAMMLTASSISARRAKGLPGALQVSFYGISLGAGAIIIIMTALGVIDPTITSIIPVGSMIIANSMNANALALERFRAEVESHVGFIEAGLALGADPGVTVQPYVQAAVKASLIPRIDSLRSLGIVWIPGIMAGMVLSGADPVYAGIYQFVIIAMIYASSGLTTVISTLLIRKHAFSAASQLSLRPQAG